MKAIQYHNYGSAEVLQLTEISKPSPAPGEILIRVYVTTVTAADVMMREGKPYIGRLFIGLNKPKNSTLGFDFAGEVVDTGEQVTKFKKGDRVFGGITSLGSYAEYLCVNENDVVTNLPENISYEQAVPLAGSAITALNFLKGLGKIKEGHKVLLIGASGAVGSYAVQYAKLVGAEVTGVCSTVNVGLVQSLGAHYVIDYTREDFISNGKEYDVIFDCVAKRSYSECKNSLANRGIYMSTVMNLQLLKQILSTSLRGSKKAKTRATGMLPVKERLSYLIELKGMLETGKLLSLIDSSLPLEQMAKAHAYVEGGRKKGNLVINI